ncbi:stage II sporulation protein Q [Bacillus sp. J14TS2]|uniref:M23 family metallopeptidase n=1 Tax=Bacillus sp. J14TS2 TaxID=2807188 RepID=UPI001B1724E6|nr:M23 family metallopeptidase [Bacillus sp. J14TS2]GIN69734.1 stage II sporulation protein Q [Bacillus sp. J14TS2]
MREEEKNQSSQWKKVLKKRWVYPAIYLASAALIISGIFWFQAANKDVADPPSVTENNTDDLLGSNNNEDAVEVTQSLENVDMPVANADEVEYVTEFFDINASEEEQEAALIVDGNKYHPNLGVDIAKKDNSEFDVLAALSGKVTAVRDDSLLGNVIEIEHDKGVTTIYQSVKNMKVQVGDSVKQGDALATSGTSQLNKDAKTHLHFEIRKDNQAVNPQSYFGQSVTSLEKDSKVEMQEKEQADESSKTDEETDSESQTGSNIEESDSESQTGSDVEESDDQAKIDDQTNTDDETMEESSNLQIQE